MINRLIEEQIGVILMMIEQTIIIGIVLGVVYINEWRKNGRKSTRQ